MKRKVSLFTATVLGIATLGLQVPWSVSETPYSASASAKDASFALAAVPSKIANVQPLHAGTTAKPSPARAFAFLAPPDPLQAVVQPDIHPRHQALARKVLGLLSADCQEKLENFYVVYDDPGHRGLAGKGVIIMNGTLPDREFIALLMHEMGHFWDLTCINGTEKAGPSAFKDGNHPVYADDPSAAFYAISWTTEEKRKATAKKTDFASGYAYSADPFEDLAEGLVYYLLQEDAFAARAKTNAVMAKKLRWFQRNLPKTTPVATGTKWNGIVVWNAAKIPYQLMGDL